MPVLSDMSVYSCRVRFSLRFCTRHDFDEFGGDRCLTCAVVVEVRESMSSEAFRLALSIAAIRAACSPAWFRGMLGE